MDVKTSRRHESDLSNKTIVQPMSYNSEVSERKRTSPLSLSSLKLFHNQQSVDTELPKYKRPKLMVDTSKDYPPLCEALSSNESFNSPVADLEAPPITGSNLSAYLEDIVSDEEPLDEATPPQSKTPPPSSPVSKWAVESKTKEELLLMMETLDRDIATVEQQISLLEKQHQEEILNQSATPSSNLTPPTSSVTSSTFTDHPSVQSSSDQSIIDVIYHENKVKAVNSHMASLGADKLNGSLSLCYYQPSEVFNYVRLREKHNSFRPKLIEYLKRKKLQKHKKELELCKEYDNYVVDWERRLDKWSQNLRKKSRDSKNKELFEKMFPELRTKRDQLRVEAYSRGGVRSFGVVRSEAELNQLAYELYEQDEARDRYHRIRAILPPMLIDKSERSVQYINTNGLITDPMAMYRESKSTSIWSEEEKTIFKSKYILFPKNFEKISSFLPNKSINECIRYYYLVKKKERFKQLTRRSSFKRRRIHKQHNEYPITSPLILEHTKGNKPRLSSSDGGHSSAPPSIITSPNPMKSPLRLSEYNGWSEKEINSLKEGLRKYGRAWGKVYREVGGGKSATQCKQFYDMYCTDSGLSLNSSLAEHSSQKNAEKVKKKMIEMKKPHPHVHQQATPIGLNKRKNIKSKQNQQQLVPAQQRVEEEIEEGKTESDIGSESDVSGTSESETTLTDSEGEESKQDPTDNNELLHSPFDIFLSAAEVLSNTVPVDIALHDHTYSRPPMDIQGSSGLQLIAAAAAVVSPNLSKVTSSKSPLSISNKAPRGRPPNQQKRSNYSQKLSPSYLTPTSGASQSVLLQDFKPAMRGRSRSAPTEKFRPGIGSIPIQTQKPVLPASVLSVKSTASRMSPSPVRSSTQTYSRSNSSKEIPNLMTAGILKSVGTTCTNTINTNGTTINSTVDTKSIGLSADVCRPTSSASGGSKTSHRKDSTVLELNLGNMALLLAATGNNQQAALLLPQSSILNKQTLAVLQGISDSTTTATINIDPSVLVSNGRNTTKDTIPLVTPTVKVTTKRKDVQSSSDVSSNGTSSIPPSSSTPSANPSCDELSNLNLLSNLVAGLSKKSDTHHSTTTLVSSGSLSSTTTVSSDTLPPKPVSLSFKKVPDEKQERKIEGTSHRSTAQSISSQSVMLYTRSLSMPLNTTSDTSTEDHLEYATREITELSKLLGTDNGLETPPTETPPTLSSHKSQWSPDDLLCNPFNDQAPPTTIHHTITSSLTATNTDLLTPPTHQMLPACTPPPINAHSESSS